MVMTMEHQYMSELAAQQEAVETDPFAAMMQQEFGMHVGAPALEGAVQYSPEEIDAQVAEFAAEMSRMEATSEDAGVEMSAVDRAVLGDRISMRAMTAEELEQVAENEARARAAVAAEYDAFTFSQLMQSSSTTDKRSND